MTFYDGTAAIGSSAVSGGSATLATSSLGIGIHTLSAKYSGDSKTIASTSNAVTQTIAGNTTVTVTGSYGTLSRTATLNVVVK